MFSHVLTGRELALEALAHSLRTRARFLYAAFSFKITPRNTPRLRHSTAPYSKEEWETDRLGRYSMMLVPSFANADNAEVCWSTQCLS